MSTLSRTTNFNCDETSQCYIPPPLEDFQCYLWTKARQLSQTKKSGRHQSFNQYHGISLTSHHQTYHFTSDCHDKNHAAFGAPIPATNEIEANTKKVISATMMMKTGIASSPAKVQDQSSISPVHGPSFAPA
jgi:hypothetical protein